MDQKKENIMDIMKCSMCGYTYDTEIGDEENGIQCGTEWNDLPEHWDCPVCNAGKEQFHMQKTCKKVCEKCA